MTDNSDFAKKKFGERYISILSQYKIPFSVHCRYIIHIEMYIKYYPDQRLKTHTKQNLETHLKELDRKTTITDFQFSQTIEALSFLFCPLLQIS